MPESAPEKNPLLDLPAETARFVGYLRNNLERERQPDEEGMSTEVVGAKRLLESMDSYAWIPEEFDTKRYVELVGKISEIEALLPQPNPSAAVEEAGLLVRDQPDKAEELVALREELASMDAQLTKKLGITPSETHARVQDPAVGEHISSYEEDRREHAAEVERASVKKHSRIAAGLAIEQKRGVRRLDIPEHIRDAIERIRDGEINAEELAPLPEKGTFQLLNDERDPDRKTPVRIFERQIIRTNRDVTSPDFSGCAAVLLYKEDAEGNPEQESIFAHLPPQTERGFESYDATFWEKQAQLTDLRGYKAKVIAGLIQSPQEIAHSLEKLGATVVTVEQIPLEMYTVLVDAKTKSMVARGTLEQVADDPSKGYYRTTGGRLPIRKEDSMPGLTYIE